MATPNRSPESIEKRRNYARNYARERVAERVEYNRGWIADNPEKVSSYRRKSRDKGESKFASGERERAKEKKCSLCKKVKIADEFYLSNINIDGLHGWRKECSDKRTRDNTRKRMFSLSPEDFAKILEAQGGGCAICKTKNNGKREFCVRPRSQNWQGAWNLMSSLQYHARKR